jgi:hypothetical protein
MAAPGVGGCAVALKLFPTITAILMDSEGTAEERLARAREVLTAGGAKLLVERTQR